MAFTPQASRERSEDFDRRNRFDMIRVYVDVFATCPLQVPPTTVYVSHDRPISESGLYHPKERSRLVANPGTIRRSC